jgi:hypothetical protein
MRTKILILMTVALLVMPSLASAAFMDYSYENKYDTDQIVFNIVELGPEASDTIYFTNMPFFGHSIDATDGWDADISNAFQTLTFSSADAIDAGTGSFNFPFYDSFLTADLLGFDFTMTWSEYDIRDEVWKNGIIQFENGVEVLHTPIPASAWMLMSGLAIFLGIRRHRAG